MMGILDSMMTPVSQAEDPLKEREKWLNMSQLFNSFTMNPQNSRGYYEGQQKGIDRQRDAIALKQANKLATTKSTNQRNSTAAWLRVKGREDLAIAMETGALTATQALAQMKETTKSAAIQRYEYAKEGGFTGSYEDWEINLQKAGVPQPEAKGDTTWQTESAKAHVSMFKSNMESSGQARKTLMSTGILDQLGNAMDSGVVPAALRKFIPEGLNGPVDAYNAILTSTALSLKGKGTGPMTDKDYDNLLATAGSISASPAARRIVQLALAENARIALQIADISAKAISGQMDRLEATSQINKLMQSEPLTDEMRSQLGLLAGGNKPKIGDIDAAIAELEAQRNK